VSTSFCIDPASMAAGLGFASDLLEAIWKPNNPQQIELVGYFNTYRELIGQLPAEGTVFKVSSNAADLNAYCNAYAGERPFQSFSATGMGIASISRPQARLARPGVATHMRVAGGDTLLAAIRFSSQDARQHGVSVYTSADSPKQPIIHLPMEFGLSLIIQEVEAPLDDPVQLLPAARKLLRHQLEARREEVHGSIVMPMVSILPHANHMMWTSGLTGYAGEKPVRIVEQAVQFYELKFNENGLDCQSTGLIDNQEVPDPQYAVHKPFIGCFMLQMDGGELPVGMFYADQSAWSRPEVGN
jgi:hypothetical protein